MANQISELSKEDVNLIADYVKTCRSKDAALINIRVMLAEESTEMTINDFDSWMERELRESKSAPEDQFIKYLISSDSTLRTQRSFKFDLTNKTRKELLSDLKVMEQLFGNNHLFQYIDYYIHHNK